jgi:nucleoside-diphosphate-sugar epimerase
MRVLITGASSFIGSHLDRELQDAGHLVSGIDGATDVRRAIASHKAEVLIHLEGESSGLLGEDSVFKTVGDTAGVTAEVAKACGELGVRLIYASTDEIYGDTGGAVSTEEGPFELPQTTYALGKLMGESLGLLYAPNGLTVLRISSTYGPGGRSAIVNLLLRAQHGLPIPVHIGAERSWCWIGDTVRAIRLVMEKSDGVYNIGRDDDSILMQDVAELICTLTGADKGLIEAIKAPAQQTVVKRLSVQKLRRLGWEPKVSLYEGMEMTLDWTRTIDPLANPRAIS